MCGWLRRQPFTQAQHLAKCVGTTRVLLERHLDFSVIGALERLEKGKLSDMVVTGDKGLFVLAVDKQAPDLTDKNPRFAESRDQIASFTARIGASAVLSELVEQELKKTTPVAR